MPPAPSLAMPTIIKPKISQKPKAPKPPVFKQKANSSSVPLYSTGNQHVSSSISSFSYGVEDDLVDDPPMPSFAPPPPPPEVFLNDTMAVSDPYGMALYDFQTGQDGDLLFRVSILIKAF